MATIKAKPINIYNIFNKAVKETVLVNAEKNIVEQIKNTYKITRESSDKLGIDRRQQEIEIREIIMNRISKILNTEESTFSTSTIEGVNIDSNDVSRLSNGIKDDKLSNNDIKEILNLNEKLLNYEFPNELTVDNIKDLHKFVYVDRRKNPGNFKASNNRVNLVSGDILEYISVSETMTEMKVLVDFINDKELDKHPLIKAAIIHVYFALIHPFQDGNGRITRLLVNKYLSSQLDFDIYIDASIDSIEDYSKYLSCFTDNEKWPLYFTYHNNLVHNAFIRLEERFEKLYDQWLQLLDLLTDTVIPKSKYIDVISFIQSNNIFGIKDLEYSLSITRVTATKYTKELVRLGIYEEYDHTQGKLYSKTDQYIIRVDN